jgi:hypothetical protein
VTAGPTLHIYPDFALDIDDEGITSQIIENCHTEMAGGKAAFRAASKLRIRTEKLPHALSNPSPPGSR